MGLLDPATDKKKKKQKKEPEPEPEPEPEGDSSSVRTVIRYNPMTLINKNPRRMIRRDLEWYNQRREASRARDEDDDDI